MKANIKDKGKWGIYCIKNTVNQKVYVGKAIDIHRRIKQHITQLNTKSKDENIYLINAWHKHSRTAFEYSVLEYIEVDDYSEKGITKYSKILAERELFWIQECKALDRNYGYNIRLDSETHCVVREETRQRLSNAQKQRYELHPEEREIIGQRSKEFWANNPDAKEQMRRSVAYKNRKFRIRQFNKQTDELIKIYEIIDDIKQEYPDFYLQAIKGCCQGTKASYKGYKWHYVELNSNQIRYKN